MIDLSAIASRLTLGPLIQMAGAPRRLVLPAAVDAMSPMETAMLGAMDKRAIWEEMTVFRNIKTVLPDF